MPALPCRKLTAASDAGSAAPHVAETYGDPDGFAGSAGLTKRSIVSLLAPVMKFHFITAVID